MNQIFVFGSNLGGYHGRGSALEAKQHHGAIQGIGVGRQGNSYAIPTKNAQLQILPITTIMIFVSNFLRYAADHPELEFDVVAIGCGLAGYSPKEIAPMFAGCSSNVHLPPEFQL